MKKQLLAFGVLLGFAMVLVACGGSEQAAVEEAAEDAMETVEETANDAMDAANEAMDDAMEATEEATEGDTPNTGTLVQ
jgi:ABC-type glycerol-3-phosphate transport system substrate-binding protein